VVQYFCFGNEPADELAVCESHHATAAAGRAIRLIKHDTRRSSLQKTQLEETYYHKIDPHRKVLLLRVYDERSMMKPMAVDETRPL